MPPDMELSVFKPKNSWTSALNDWPDSLFCLFIECKWACWHLVTCHFGRHTPTLTILIHSCQVPFHSFPLTLSITSIFFLLFVVQSVPSSHHHHIFIMPLGQGYLLLHLTWLPQLVQIKSGQVWMVSPFCGSAWVSLFFLIVLYWS